MLYGISTGNAAAATGSAVRSTGGRECRVVAGICAADTRSTSAVDAVADAASRARGPFDDASERDFGFGFEVPHAV